MAKPYKTVLEGDKRDCKRCGHHYTVTEGMILRKSYSCPKCASLNSKRYRLKHLEHYRLLSAEKHRRDGSNPEKTRRYRTRYPERRIAMQKVQTAIRNGSLVKRSCIKCNSPISTAHHNDYSKPLDVVWLCHRHHMEAHGRLIAELEKGSK